MARHVIDMVFNIYGTIAYNDHSHAPIEATFAHGEISNPYSNLENFSMLHRDKASVLRSFLHALFPGIVILVPTVPPVPPKAIKNVVLAMSGTVAYNDRSHQSFVVEYRDGVVSFSPPDVAADWATMLQSQKPLQVLEKLTGVGGVLLSMYLFTDCFECDGTISAANPGPVCGWTFDNVFNGGNATMTFATGSVGTMTINTVSDTDYPIMRKPLPDTLTDLFDLSGRFDFTEYQTTPNAETTYQYWVNNSDTSQELVVSLFGDGSVIFQVGPVDACHTYLGTWTPNGGNHSVYFYSGTDGSVPPSVFLDGVEVSLSFYGDVGTFATVLPSNMIAIAGGAGDPASATSVVTNVFLMTGDVGVNTPLNCQ